MGVTGATETESGWSKADGFEMNGPSVLGWLITANALKFALFRLARFRACKPVKIL